MEASEPTGDPTGAEAGAEQPSQEELRRRLEEQLRKVRVEDMLLESVASILNLSARRVAKEDERDLDQARVGIDAVRALLDLLAPEHRAQVQSALSELQMMYAREAGGGASAEGPGGPAEPEPGSQQERPAGGRGSGLWTPPGAA
ncbi:MAG TPA: hypothetical protein VK919_00170 [Solirubrobacterales bacterium]|nr:hypothetical protein [Solirubrobacterales bacterium]